MLLEAKNVSKQYGGQTVLDSVSMAVAQQSIYGLLGPNGAGKTTLIRIINQITGPDSGELLLDGKKLAPEDVVNIGYLPEERGLYKKMKVGEQALYFAQLKGLTGSEAVKRLRYWFGKLDIAGWWDKKVEELSKGMAQKVQFIITVLHEPRLLIFDEPFSGFDPVNADIIRNEILLLREKGATIIFSTHNMESVEALCDNITLIDRSKAILQGSVGDIRNKWAADEYDVVIDGDANPENSSLYSTAGKSFEGGQSHIRIRATGGAGTNDMLYDLMKHGSIVSFRKALPSMNEIFLRVVQSRS